MITKESLVDLQEKYEKVKKLIEEDAKFDPETEPYFSKYQARQHLISMNGLLENLLAKQEPDTHEYYKLIGMHGAVQLELGIIAVDTEELTIGSKHLSDCIKIIENREELPEIASVTINAYNQLGLLHARNEPECGQVYLEKAEALYKKLSEQNIVPIDCSDLFINSEFDKDVANTKFQKTHTLTLYYLAQVYGSIDPLKSAVYCHKTLQRQLEGEDYEQIDWALNTATLSQFLMEKNGFKQARHHLAASLYMLDEHKKILDAVEDQNEEFLAKMETFRHRSADIARCWAKYGLILLCNSKDRLLNSTDSDVAASLSTDISRLKLEENSSLTQEDLQNFDFNIDLSPYEVQVTDKFVLTIEDARKVFLNAQEWLQKAQEYYTLNTLASDHIEIIQDHSKLYDALGFFEENPENQAKLLKRGITVLEKVLNEVNPTYYMGYCRQMWFRLGNLYSDILNIKLEKIKEIVGRPTPHALNKVNSLVEKSNSNFLKFINSLKMENGKAPEDLEKPYTQALFHLAALQTRYITLNKETQIKNTEKSLEYYKKLIDYTETYKKAAELAKEEISVAKQLAVLLPLKIKRLQSELVN